MLESWKEVKQFLKNLIEAQQISDHEVIRRAGLSRSTYYQLFDPARENSPMRQATVFALAKVLYQGVKYIDGIPQFSPILARSKNITAEYVQKAITDAIHTVGSIEKLSRLADLNIFQMQTLLNLSPNTVIDMSTLDQVSIAIEKLDLDRISEGSKSSLKTNFEEGHPVGSNVSEGDTGIKVLKHDELENVSDHGLLQLITEENLKKYNISDTERSELSMISQNRNSQTTIEHWVSILYALRALEQK